MHGQSIGRAISPEHAALGLAARRIRGWRGLSQEEVGFRGRLHRNYVGAIERGTINPTFRVLLKLATGLRISLSDLIVIYERNAGKTPPPPLANAT